MSKLGKEVKDRISGFRGIVVSETHYLQGCTRLCVQPVVKRDGTFSDSKAFDEPDLIVIGDGVSEAKPKAPRGGPRFIPMDKS